MRLRVLLSGPGLIGHRHAALVRERSDCELVGIVAPGRAANRSVATEFNAAFYEDFHEALNVTEPDAVIVSSPNEFHHAQALACIRNGTPVLVEKPICDSLDDAENLMRASEEAGVPVLVGHHRTHSALLEHTKQVLEADSFGSLVAINAMALLPKPAQYFVDGPWRRKKGGGPIMINLIHEIGVLRYLAGPIVQVGSIVSKATRGFEVEDTAAITLRFETGALATVLLSDTTASKMSWELTSNENSDYPHQPADRCYHFAGTRASLDFPTMQLTVSGTGGEPSWWERLETRQLTRSANDPLRSQFDHFVDVARRQCEPKVSARDGCMNLRVIHAIQHSAATGAMVDVESEGFE